MAPQITGLPPTATNRPLSPPQPATMNQIRWARVLPRQEARDEVIDIDEHDEEHTNPSDGEDDKGSDDAVEVLPPGEPPVKSGVKVSPHL